MDHGLSSLVITRTPTPFGLSGVRLALHRSRPDCRVSCKASVPERYGVRRLPWTSGERQRGRVARCRIEAEAAAVTYVGRTAATDESEQWLERAAGRCAAAPLISRRLHWPEPTPAPDDTRARRPGACRRARLRRTPAAALERLAIILSVPERTPPPPRRLSGHALPMRGRRRRRPPPRHPAARPRRPARGANGPRQPAPRAPSSPARRPDRLAFSGCCPDRREGPVSAARSPLCRCSELPTAISRHEALAVGTDPFTDARLELAVWGWGLIPQGP